VISGGAVVGTELSGTLDKSLGIPEGSHILGVAGVLAGSVNLAPEG